MPEAAAPFPTLSTPRLTLREVAETDLDAIFETLSDPEVVKFDNWEVATSKEKSRRIVKWMRGLWPKNAGCAWVIAGRDGHFHGCVRYNWIDRRWRRGEIGYELRRSSWGQGIASEAVSAIVAFGHGPFRLNRIQAWTLPGNAASDRVLEKNGFKFEGVARHNGYFKGAFHDFRNFARLKDDPSA